MFEVKPSLPHTSTLLNDVLKPLCVTGGLLYQVADLYRGILALPWENVFIRAFLTLVSAWLSPSLKSNKVIMKNGVPCQANS